MTERLWTPTFVGLSLAGLCSSMIFYLLVPTMAGYAMERFGSGPTAAGALASVFFIGALLARLVSGWLVERLGTRLMALVAVSFYLLTTAGYLITPTIETTMGLRLLNGVGFGLFSSALATGVMMIVPARRRAEGAGWFGVSLSLAIGLGPFLALQLKSTPWGMQAVFVAALGCALVAFVLILTAGGGLPGHTAPEPGHESGGWRNMLEGRAVGIGVAMLFGGFTYAAILTFLDEATSGTHLAAAAAWFFLVYSIGVMVVRPVAGRLQDARGERIVLIPAWIFNVIAVAMVAFANHGAVLLAAAAILALGWGSITTGAQAATVNRVPPARTGAAIATYYFLLDLGTGIGPIVLGTLVGPFGYRGVFIAAVLACVTGFVAYLVHLRRRPPSPGIASASNPG
ncbi:MFS transporter [Enemella sp. A6]|uniref:MFS transporter n=1 Tax=Enemella sp. A6 TaxID=3440152 RepID=UPI003EBD2CE3